MGAANRKSPTREQLHIWREFRETSDRLNAELASRMQRASAVSPADYQVLLVLSEAPEQQYRSSELAEWVGWERSRLSHHLGRMQRRGLISRVASANDSRGSEIRLTEDGADAFRRCSVPHLRDIRTLFIDALTSHQLASFADATAALKSHLEELTGTR